MGFFKDFKDDFSQAVNELMPGEDNLEDGAANEDLVVNTLENSRLQCRISQFRPHRSQSQQVKQKSNSR